jgi:hypothetical protein
MRLRADWLIATAAPKLTGTYGLRMRGRESFTEIQLAARRRVARALRALPQRLRPVVIDVCGFDNWAAERLKMLREALTLLADQLGLPKEGR